MNQQFFFYFSSVYEDIVVNIGIELCKDFTINQILPSSGILPGTILNNAASHIGLKLCKDFTINQIPPSSVVLPGTALNNAASHDALLSTTAHNKERRESDKRETETEENQTFRMNMQSLTTQKV